MGRKHDEASAMRHFPRWRTNSGEC